MAFNTLKGTQLAEAGAPQKMIAWAAINSENKQNLRDLQVSHLAREHCLSRAMARLLAEHVFGEDR